MISKVGPEGSYMTYCWEILIHNGRESKNFQYFVTEYTGINQIILDFLSN